MGKTFPWLPGLSRKAVHPHACGENLAVFGGHRGYVGSPPRVWGKRSETRRLDRRQRFTPTRVGKTVQLGITTTWTAVHPHACGENREKRAASAARDGSPPRVWGKRAGVQPRFCPVRFTPTRVGKTARNAAAQQKCAVHPHACGENAPVANWHIRRVGSPPRVWGKRKQ